MSPRARGATTQAGSEDGGAAAPGLVVPRQVLPVQDVVRDVAQTSSKKPPVGANNSVITQYSNATVRKSSSKGTGKGFNESA